MIRKHLGALFHALVAVAVLAVCAWAFARQASAGEPISVQSHDAMSTVLEVIDELDSQIVRRVRSYEYMRLVQRRLAWRQRIREKTTAAFQSMLAHGTVLSHIDVATKRIALTLDDGPSPLTPRTLAILAKHQVVATFFLVGSHAEQYPGYVRMIREGGHEIENHTWSHELGYPYTPTQFTTSPLPHQLEELTRTDRGLHEHTRFMRAPGGLFGPCGGTVEAARELGKVIVNWDVDGDTPGWQHIADGKIVGVSPHDVLNAYEARILPGSIILMHPENRQDAPYTLDILETFVTDMQKQGYTFVTLDELIQPAAVAHR